MYHSIALILFLAAWLVWYAFGGRPALWHFYLIGSVCLGFSAFVVASFVVHRRLFVAAMQPLELSLLRFRYSNGFISWDTPPVWWEWRTVYDCDVVDLSGIKSRYSFSVSGPFFALFRQEHRFSFVHTEE